jgi:hypothetical protein
MLSHQASKSWKGQLVCAGSEGARLGSSFTSSHKCNTYRSPEQRQQQVLGGTKEFVRDIAEREGQT